MRIVAAVLTAMLLCSPVSAATLQVSATAPTQDNSGTCGAPVLVPNVSTRVWVGFAWSGAVSGIDSMLTALGTRVTLSRNVPAGWYAVRAWASDSGGVSCDTTINVLAKGPPDKPRDLAR